MGILRNPSIPTCVNKHLGAN